MERRNHGRLACERVRCELGELLDMSGGGMRVRASTDHGLAPGDRRALTLVLEDGHLGVTTRVVWMRRLARRRWEIGLSFTDLTPEVRSRLFLASRSMSEAAVGRPTGC